MAKEKAALLSRHPTGRILGLPRNPAGFPRRQPGRFASRHRHLDGGGRRLLQSSLLSQRTLLDRLWWRNLRGHQGRICQLHGPCRRLQLVIGHRWLQGTIRQPSVPASKGEFCTRHEQDSWALIFIYPFVSYFVDYLWDINMTLDVEFYLEKSRCWYSSWSWKTKNQACFFLCTFRHTRNISIPPTWVFSDFVRVFC